MPSIFYRMVIPQFVYSYAPADGYLGCFLFGVSTYKAAMNIHQQVFSVGKSWGFLFVFKMDLLFTLLK